MGTTPNLGLKRVDKATNGNLYFDTDSHLDENWVKIDAAVAAQQAESVQVINVKTAHGAKGDGTTDDTAAIQAAVDAIGRGTGEITRGSIFFPKGTYIISSTIQVNQQAIKFFGVENAIFKWAGDNTSAMFRVVDSSRCSFDSLTFLGDLDNPPTAAIHLDHPVPTTLGTNEYILINYCQFGRKYSTDTTTGGSDDETPVGKLQRGIWIGGANSGDNDSFYINKCQIHNCSIAGIAIDNDQSIWGSLQDLVINDCEIGLITGASTSGYNLGFNRCATADIKLIRDCQVSVWGMNSEHSGRNIWSQSGGSIYIDGGILLINTEITSAYWAYLENGGDLVIRNLLVFEQEVSGSKLYASTGSLKKTSVFMRTSIVPGGDDGSGFEIQTNGIGSLDCFVDIEHRDFVIKGKNPNFQINYNPASIADGSGVITQNSLFTAALGDFFIPAFTQDLQGILLTGNCYQSNSLYAIFHNETGSTIDLPSGTLRWKKIDRKEIKSIGFAVYNPPLLDDGQGVTTTITVPGATFGDFVVWGSTSNYSSVLVTAYVSASNTVSVRIQNESSGASDIASGTLYCAVLREVGDYIAAGLLDFSSLADGQGVTTTISVKGAKLGDFCVASLSIDIMGLILTAYVESDDIVAVRLQNETGAAVDLAEGTLRVMTFRY